MVRLALATILFASALLYSWNIGYSGLSTYYAAAAKSMSGSARAMMFGSLDPAATITLDKLSGFLVPQALSIRIFGFHAWALSLPQVIEGVVTVFAGYLVGLRWRGAAFGLAVAALLAVTPMLAAMFGRPMEDGMLTMCEALAFVALQRALRTRSLGWLILAASWVAVGFQAKMMQAWLFLPAVIVAYLFGGREPIRVRLTRLAVACGVCVLLSVTWMTAIQLVPAASRPFVDGTTNNTMFAMVFGYNGFDRLLQDLVPGAVQQLNAMPGGGGNHTRTALAGASVAKLLLPQFSTQIGWLYPVAIVGLAASLRRTLTGVRSGTSTDPRSTEAAASDDVIEDATTVGLVAWLGMSAAVLSVAFVPHATYFGVIALPIAAFAVRGAVSAVSGYRSASGSRAWMLLPIVIAVQTAWAIAIVALAVAQLRPLIGVILAAGVLSVSALSVARYARRRRLRGVGIAAGLCAALAGPILWSFFTVGSGGGGSASDAFAGPRIGALGARPLFATGHAPGLVHLHLPFTVPRGPHLTANDSALLHYVEARNSVHAIPFASDTLPIVVNVILDSPSSPMPMGGFSSRAPEPSERQLLGLIHSDRLRYVLLQDSPPIAEALGNPVVMADRAWVKRHCTATLDEAFRARSRLTQTLYDCAGAIPHR